MSSVTPSPANDVQLPLSEVPVGMDTVTGDPGAVKSTPPPLADCGELSPAVTDTSQALLNSLDVAPVNAARTRTSGVSPSVKPSSNTIVVEESVSTVNVTSKSSSVIVNDVPVTEYPVASPSTAISSFPSAIVS